MRSTVLVALVGALGLAVAGAARSVAAPVGTPPEVVTPLVANPLDAPQPERGADGRIHLVYELFVTNPTSSVMRLTRLKVLDARTGETLDSERGRQIVATLKGTDLDGATGPIVPGSKLSVGPAQVTRLFLDVRFRSRSRLPRRLAHRFTFTMKPPSGRPSVDRVLSGLTTVVNRRPVVIGPPLAGPGWLTAAGCCFPPSYHRRATLPVNGQFHAPQRFAIDYVRLNAQNRLFSGQVIALLGNTGNSTGPHLHFHIMDGPGPLSSEGVPYEIRRFSVRGTLASSLMGFENGAVARLNGAARGTHRDQMPLQNEVIDFPG